MSQAGALAHRSYSQLNALRNCGEMFRLERIEQVPQRPSVPAVAGKVIHTATETVDHLMHEGERDPLRLEIKALEVAERELQVEIEYEAKKNDQYADPSTWKRYGRATVEKPNAEDVEWFSTRGIPAAISTYINWRLASGLDILNLEGFGPAIEVPFEVTLQGVLIHGYIDRIFHRDNNCLIVDLKSGQKPKTDEQLGIYRAAVLAQYGVDITYGAYLYAMKTGEAKLTHAISLTHWTPEKLARVYVEGSKLIDQSIYLPSPGEQCFRCSVSEHCEFAQSAI